MTKVDRWVVYATLVCLAALAVAGGASHGVVAQQETDADEGTANATVQHVRPGSVERSGDLRRVQRWLGGRLSERLGTSTVALSRGEYERARSLLGDRYQRRFAKYVDVAGETRQRDATETYRAVRRDQRTLASRLQRFERAEQRYLTARENGNTAAARRAARRMGTLSERIEATGGNVTRNYETLADRTGADTSRERAIVTNVTRQVRERGERVQSVTLVETTVTVLDATRRIAFTDPLAVTGRLETANGTVLADRRVTVAVDGRARRVETDGAGRFDLAYRPRTLRANASRVDLAYVPRNDSVYVGSTTNVSVTVEQVRPTVTVRSVPTAVRYGESTAVTAAAVVDGRPVRGVPVAAAVGDERFASATTTGDGSTHLASPLPAGVPAGDRELTVAVAQRGRAIAVANASAGLTVEPTATTLDVAGQRADGAVRVTGRLATADGRPLADRPVTITRNGTAASTVRTGPDGRYAATVSPGSGARLTVGARFDGAGTSLEPARATATLSLAGQQGFLDGVPDGAGVPAVPTTWLVAGLAGLVVLVGGVTLLGRSRRESASADADASEAERSATSASDGDDAGSEHALRQAEALLERGSSAAAVRAAYAAVRERYAAGEPTGTHLDVLAGTHSLADEERTALERVVRVYETVAFSADEPDTADANEAVAAARSALGTETAGGGRDD